ncbi:MAG: argininosuccinate lyase [Candidatus Omnitrophica bacterium]|nr:argininosuccinate lyase [Candidatus Omnitrophota bacterium]
MATLWGGRFKKPIDPDFETFSRSIQYDYRLAEYDIYHSLIHTRALKNGGILDGQECERILAALGEVLREVEQGTYTPDAAAEDIHSEIHGRLEKKIGALAAKLHTLRSRNDQIAFDEKYYCLQVTVNITRRLEDVLDALMQLSRKYPEQPFVGYTHTQRAQVVLFSDYLGAFFLMFKRDLERIKEFGDRTIPYIGAGALAGSSLNRKDYARAIQDLFGDTETAVRPVENSLDNVADRDFLAELLSILSIVQMHLSRLAEDFILYSTQEFALLDLPEEFCTGSSLMPHKKNPDFLELVRGYTGKIYGNLMALLTTMKGLPLTYNRDMQLDKEPVFEAVAIVEKELQILAKLLPGVAVEEAAVARALQDEFLYATEIAEFLVFQRVAFKEAHDIVGRLVRYAKENKVSLKTMSDGQLAEFHPALRQQEMARIIDPQYAISSKKTISHKLPEYHA